MSELTINHFGVYILQLKFIHFDVEYSTNCTRDNLEIWDGPHKVNNYCGHLSSPNPTMNTPENMETFSNNVNINFLTDSSVADKGWKIQWQSIPGSFNFYCFKQKRFTPKKKYKLANSTSIQLIVQEFMEGQYIQGLIS